MIFNYKSGNPLFIITGTGRCGTVYLAKVLTAIGISCGHEMIFNPDMQRKNSSISSKLGLHTECLLAESSYMAAPFLKDNKSNIIHLVRNPLKVVLSFYNNNYFSNGNDSLKWENFIKSHLPEINDIKGRMNRCCYYVIQWNRMIEPYAHRRIRLEYDVKDFIEGMGCRLPDIPPVNTFEEWANPIENKATIEDILKLKIGSQLIELGKKYGYEI